MGGLLAAGMDRMLWMAGMCQENLWRRREGRLEDVGWLGTVSFISGPADELNECHRRAN